MNHDPHTWVKSEADLRERLTRIRAVVCDWDGVFNDGSKDNEGGSPFSEVDSMGLNLLRFALWLRKEELPHAAIITGQLNHHAERFAMRERLHGVYMGFTHKPEAFDAFLGSHCLEAGEVLFVYDDVLDLPVASRCGLRVLVGHRATERFQRTCIERGLVDLHIPFGGAHHALRAACEHLIAAMGCWDRVIDHRVAYDGTYQRYLVQRQAVSTTVDHRQR